MGTWSVLAVCLISTSGEWAADVASRPKTEELVKATTIKGKVESIAKIQPLDSAAETFLPWMHTLPHMVKVEVTNDSEFELDLANLPILCGQLDDFTWSDFVSTMPLMRPREPKDAQFFPYQYVRSRPGWVFIPANSVRSITYVICFPTSAGQGAKLSKLYWGYGSREDAKPKYAVELTIPK